MGGTIKVRVVGARDLPVMNRSTKLTDAYVAVKFADLETQKTEISKDTLNPVWNEDFRIEVAEDSDLQDHPLELQVWDHDVVTSDDFIGTVYVDLNPLLSEEGPSSISGWFPLFDTIQGIRGQLFITVKLQLIDDVNPFKDSSAGIQFFSAPAFPSNYSVQQMYGLVEDLLVAEDPEHYWIDNFRSSRTSNEDRQLLFFQLAGQVRRNIGRKVAELGGNAVIGFDLCFDLDEKNGIVARGYGTACKLSKAASTPAMLSISPGSGPLVESPSPSPSNDRNSFDINSGAHIIQALQRRKSRKGTLPSVTGAAASSSGAPDAPGPKKREVMLCTIKEFPKKFIRRMAGVVNARSVKLLTDAKKSDEAADAFDAWWNEVREEVRGHARSLACTHVIGYTEYTSIDDDVCVFSATGTAVVLETGADDSDHSAVASKRAPKKGRRRNCSFCHIPYRRGSSPFSMRLVPCEVCGRRFVPEIILSTTEIPQEAMLTGSGCLVEARVCRPRKRPQGGDANAQNLSEVLPFVEYDLHRQLMYKLKVYSLNAAFGLRIRIALGESFIVATATATGAYLTALPPPPALQITRTLRVVDDEDKEMVERQRRIQQLSQLNVQQRFAHLTTIPHLKEEEGDEDGKKGAAESSSSSSDSSSSSSSSDEERDRDEKAGSDSGEDAPAPAHTGDTEDQYVVEIDDETDEDIMAVLLDSVPPHGLHLYNTNSPPSRDVTLHTVQNIRLVRRYLLNAPQQKLNQQLAAIFQDMHTYLIYKLRYLVPCAVSAVTYDVKLVGDEEIQIALSTMVVLNGKKPRRAILSRHHTPSFIGHVRDLPPPINLSSSPMRSDPSLSFTTPLSSQRRDSTPTLSASTPTTISALSSQVASQSVGSGSGIPRSTSALSLAIQQQERVGKGAEDSVGLGGVSSGGSSAQDQEGLSSCDARHFVLLTPLHVVHNAVVEEHIGNVSLHFIKESWEADSENGGVGSFYHQFLSQAHAVVRAHVCAMGGNALVDYKVHQHLLLENSRNQAYSLITITGDVQKVTMLSPCEGLMKVAAMCTGLEAL